MQAKILEFSCKSSIQIDLCYTVPRAVGPSKEYQIWKKYELDCLGSKANIGAILKTDMSYSMRVMKFALLIYLSTMEVGPAVKGDTAKYMFIIIGDINVDTCIHKENNEC